MTYFELIILVLLIVWFVLWYSDHERERRQRVRDKWAAKQLTKTEKT